MFTTSLASDKAGRQHDMTFSSACKVEPRFLVARSRVGTRDPSSTAGPVSPVVFGLPLFSARANSFTSAYSLSSGVE